MSEPSPEPLPVNAVLVVEDSAVQRMHVAEVCREFGIQTIYEAGDGEEALGILASLPQLPDAAIVDLEMPGMDGVQLLQQLVERQLRLPVVIASGMEASIIRSVESMIRTLRLPVLAALKKPITAEKLREALAGAGGPVRKAASPERAEPELGAADLAMAIYGGQIHPHYQPQLDLRSGQVASVEALARWLHPVYGPVSPARFIPLAEANALIHGLTLCITEQVLSDLVLWDQLGLRLNASINLSARQLSDPNVVEDLDARVRRHGLEPRRVTWEITESSVVGDLGMAIGNLARLRLKGFGLSLDDYGTGFSSMQQLSRLPFSELKIDQSFVSGAADKPHLHIIVQSAVDMAHKLNLVTVAEGVEAELELRVLQQLGCDMVQGYFLARPMPASELQPWLAGNAARMRGLLE